MFLQSNIIKATRNAVNGLIIKIQVEKSENASVEL